MLELERKTRKMCRFEIWKGCRFSAEECRFVHLTLLPLAAKSNIRQLAWLAANHWEEGGLAKFYTPQEERMLLPYRTSNL